MIRSLNVDGLNQRMSFSLQFNKDIIIITGKNGSGKTTILKLLWYAISGNLERIVEEINCDAFELISDEVNINLTHEKEGLRKIQSITYTLKDAEPKVIRSRVSRPIRSDDLVEANRKISRATGASVFFPTFRRIEGGFSISGNTSEERVVIRNGIRMVTRTSNSVYGERGELQSAMYRLSDRVSVGNHRLVASISTDDINQLLTSKFADVSEKSNKEYMELARFILDHVGEEIDDDQTGTGTGTASDLLTEVRNRARSVTQKGDQLKLPFTVLSDLIRSVFQYKGIRINEPLTLGETKEAIASDVLSAGEKQMLSFLCYNAFTTNAAMFIDEPEISLHVDWQRLLFPILLGQASGNQFIIATHSPFIYAKYADKELLLADRGDTDADSAA